MGAEQFTSRDKSVGQPPKVTTTAAQASPARRAWPYAVAALLALVGLADMGANAAYGLAVDAGGPVAVSAVLASLYPVVTALLARQLLAERLRPVQVVGVAAALGGVCLLVAAG